MTIFDKLKEGIACTDVEMTHEIGRAIAAALPDDSVIGLRGDLGAGKTTLVQGMAHGLEIDEPVTSPTYTIYGLYHGTRTLLHMDAYRLGTEASLDPLGIEECLKSPWLMVVEWPENVKSWIKDWKPIYLDLTLDRYQVHTIRMAK